MGNIIDKLYQIQIETEDFLVEGYTCIFFRFGV